MCVKKYAVCALVLNSEGLILGVSRKDDHTAFGVPGGKVEDNETVVEALHREMLEETGYHIIVDNELPFVSDVDGYTTATFKVKIDTDAIQHSITETGVVKYVSKQTLLDGPFGQYNKQLFKFFNI